MTRSSAPFLRGAAALIAGLSLWLAPVSAWAAPDAYKLGYGDAVNVTVVGQPNLSVSGQPVRPDGHITLPLIQEVVVQGKTIPEVTAALASAYKGYLTMPQVVVSVAKFRALHVTVLGQVAKPGSYEFEHPPTLLEALATAGGLSERADKSALKVVAPSGESQIYSLQGLLSAKQTQPFLAEGSTIEVEEVWIPDLYKLIPVVASVITATGVALRLVYW